MVQRLIVPVDGSPTSWTAFDVAASLARRRNLPVDVVQVEFDPDDRDATLRRLNDELARHDVTGVEVTAGVELADLTVADELAIVMLRHPGATIVMSSQGRGRSAAIVGSVAEEVLSTTFGPIMLIGPHTRASDFTGPVVVSVDGSDESEAAVGVAVRWAIELDVRPWIVHTAGPNPPTVDDVPGSAYLSRLAQDHRELSGYPVEFDQLHDGDPVVAVPDFARRLGASLIVASSHGRSGWSRLTMGSVTSGFVRHSTCPVLVVRLPDPTVATVATAGAGRPAGMGLLTRPAAAMDAAIPAGFEHTRTTATFDNDSAPAGLLKAHRVADGVWGRLVVHTGEVVFVFEDAPAAPVVVAAGGHVDIPPTRPHHVELGAPATFAVEFYRTPSSSGSADGRTGLESTGLAPEHD